MPNRDYAKELESAADRIGEMSHGDIQIILRRAAIRIRNAGSIALDEDVANALDSVGAEMGKTRSDTIRMVLREWLEKNGHLLVHNSDEDRGVEGRA